MFESVLGVKTKSRDCNSPGTEAPISLLLFADLHSSTLGYGVGSKDIFIPFVESKQEERLSRLN